jgi:hypothetical protein
MPIVNLLGEDVAAHRQISGRLGRFFPRAALAYRRQDPCRPPGDLAQLPELGDREAGQIDGVGPAVLRLRDEPRAGFEVDVGPCRGTEFADAGEGGEQDPDGEPGVMLQASGRNRVAQFGDLAQTQHAIAYRLLATAMLFLDAEQR